MTFLRRLLLLDPIYSRPTIGGVISNLAYLLIAGLFLSSFLSFSSGIIALLVASILVYLFRQVVLSTLIQRRFRSSAYKITAPKGWSLFSTASLYQQLNEADKTETLQYGDDWQIYDTTFNFYRRTRSGEYLSKQVYYTVYEQKLHRELPHLVFDNKHARGRQFRFRYLGTQKLSLEGNFDDHFETYSPDYYKIDSLSFITPEVMQVLLEQAGCDVEISGDRLFVYTSLLDLQDIPKLQAFGSRLSAALNDNIDTYRDSYLSGPERTTTTTAFARQLLKSPVRAAVSLGLMTAVLFALLAYAITQDIGALLSEPAAYIYVLFSVAFYRLYKIERENREKLEEFAAVRRPAVRNPQHR